MNKEVKIKCPKCGEKEFVLDKNNGKYHQQHTSYGKCKCGYKT